MEFVHNGVLYIGVLTGCAEWVDIRFGGDAWHRNEVLTRVPFEPTWIETARVSIDGIYAMAA